MRVHFVLLFVQIAFASGAIVGKWVLNDEHVNPTALALMRAGGAAIALHILAWFTHRQAMNRIGTVASVGLLRFSGKDHLRLAGLSILGVVINQIFFLYGLKRGTASSAAVLAATIPVFTAVVAWASGRERLSPRVWLGIGIATLGVVILTGVKNVDTASVLVTINSLSYGAYLVFAGPAFRAHGAIRVMAWVFTYGALLIAPFGLPALVHEAAGWSSRGWLLVGYFVLVPTILAYLGNAFALAWAPPSLVAVYIYLQPMLVLVFAGKLLGEALSLRVGLATVAIAAGVSLVVRRKAQPSKLPEGEVVTS